MTPKPTGERPARGETTPWALALYTRRTAYIYIYIVCVSVCASILYDCARSVCRVAVECECERW